MCVFNLIIHEKIFSKKKIIIHNCKIIQNGFLFICCFFVALTRHRFNLQLRKYNFYFHIFIYYSELKK